MYPNYGARGIIMCDEWLNDRESFYEHIGERPTPNHSIDRIDNNGNYEPGNLRWATQSEQANNKRLPRISASNTSGYKGVAWNHGRWRAQKKFRNKEYYLGRYKTAVEAHRAVVNFEKKVLEG